MKIVAANSGILMATPGPTDGASLGRFAERPGVGRWIESTLVVDK